MAGAFGKAIGSGGRLVVQMVVGGTLSEATGGKFANGAAYAAFAEIVSLGGRSAREVEASRVGSNSRQKSSTLELSLVDDGGHLTADEAALASFEHNEDLYLQTTKKQEVTGLIFENETNGRFYFTEGGIVSTNFKATIRTIVPESLQGASFKFAGDFHTHPYTRGTNQEGFSRGDNNKRARFPRYLRTPKGDARVLRSFNRNTIDGTARGSSICPTPNCLTPHPSVPR